MNQTSSHPIGKMAKLQSYGNFEIVVFRDCDNFKVMLEESEDTQLEDLVVNFEMGTYVMVVEHFNTTVKRVYLDIGKVEGTPMPADYDEEYEEYDLYKIIGPDGKTYWCFTDVVEVV
jgi:hypothetical protein